MLAMLFARRLFTGALGALALIVFNLFIRSVIPATSRLNVIKYANLISLLRTNELLGGYRNLIDRHISPGIGNIPLTELTQDTVTGFYDSLRSRGLSARSVWCVHLLLRRCMDEAARDQLIPCNPAQICSELPAEAHKTVSLRLGQLQRYLNAAEQFGTLPLIYTGLTSGLRQCELLTLSWADFYIRYRYILKGQRLLTLGSKAEHLLEQIPETGCYVFLNPTPGAP